MLNRKAGELCLEIIRWKDNFDIFSQVGAEGKCNLLEVQNLYKTYDGNICFVL
jgi:hypothetical protein